MLTHAVVAPYLIGVSHKMYLSHARAIAWTSAVAELALDHPALVGGLAELFVAPSHVALAPAAELLRGTGVRLAAQDASWMDTGAFTGENSPAVLAEVGCSMVELGHAERRRLFGEHDTMVAKKTQAAFRNGLTPILCVGEVDPRGDAARLAIAQLDAALSLVDDEGTTGPVVVAYEPVWAIGADRPAPTDHVVEVVQAIDTHLAQHPLRPGSRVIYGGSAGPGTLARFGGEVRGLFLGRFAHEPAALRDVCDEVAALVEASIRPAFD
ncbi:triose-phosphate isomerase family protein [Agromyces silvae]|uniref:triose-phosphate isomerase family protein n=1 Tax=Agromyces silvae TaxID=3388266 RepID=UPI00280B9F5B|nr:triose-phosphate isomerase family protein [Agromyces protaetiae]